MAVIVTRTSGRHRLISGDCLAALPGLASDSVDVVVTSPPYNIGLNYSKYLDSKAEPEFLEWLVTVLTEVKRVMKPGASLFLNMSGTGTAPWVPFELAVRLRSLFVLQNHIVWAKAISIGEQTIGHYKPVNSKRFLNHLHEHVFHLTKTGTVPLDRLSIGVPYEDKSNITRRQHAVDLHCRGDIWFIPYETVQSRDGKHRHPSTYPTMLPRWCIRLHGQKEAIVLDPFMGSGTTLVAAELEGASGIGIELDPTYVRTARSRLNLARRQRR